jgi:flagellar FliL protein
MAGKGKAEAPPPKESDSDDADAPEAVVAAPKKKGLVGRILGPVFFILSFANPLKILKLPRKLQLVAAGGLLVVLAGGGAAVYFLVLSAPKTDAAANASVQTAAANLPAAQATFFDVPDIVVNIQGADAAPAYLKLSVALELDKVDAKAAIEPVMPRIIDQFQTYLRELRVEDIRGSAGVMRLKEELLRRVNLAVAPTPVRDVLLKEMIVQ